jgi:hypothetical protein
MLESGVLRRTFGTRRKEITRGWRQFHNEDLNFYTEYYESIS